MHNLTLCQRFYPFKHLQHAWMHEHTKTKTVTRVELKKLNYQTKLKPANPTPFSLAVTQTQTHFLPLYLDSCPLCCALVFDLWFNAPFPLETLAHSGAKLQKKEREREREKKRKSGRKRGREWWGKCMTCNLENWGLKIVSRLDSQHRTKYVSRK